MIEVGIWKISTIIFHFDVTATEEKI